MVGPTRAGVDRPGAGPQSSHYLPCATADAIPRTSLTGTAGRGRALEVQSTMVHWRSSTGSLNTLIRSCHVQSHMNGADRLTASSCGLTFDYQKMHRYLSVPFTGFAVEAENDTSFRSLQQRSYGLRFKHGKVLKSMPINEPVHFSICLWLSGPFVPFFPR